jgi:DNA-binding NtrC family response regulator
MKTYVVNLFIIDNDKLVLTGLKNYLDHRFGTSINVSTFQDSNTMLQKIEKYTNIVISESKTASGVLNSVKEINPKTEVLIFSTYENIGNAILYFQNGTIEDVIQNEKFYYNIPALFYKMFTTPIRIIIKGFGVSKLRAIH